jgi:HK97 family phage prohead protease
MFAHDYTKPAVGKALGIAVLGDSLRARVQFAPTALGRELDTLYSQGFMRAWSIGFDVKESQPRKGKGRRYTRQELLEVSAVPVPSNPNALTE